MFEQLFKDNLTPRSDKIAKSGFTDHVKPFTEVGLYLKALKGDNGWGAVGRAVASNIRDLRFESSHQKILFGINCFQNRIEKTKKRNRDRIGPI